MDNGQAKQSQKTNGDDMDIKATLRLWLSDKKDTFNLDGACVCCGRPSVEVWTYNKKYNLERWVASSGGRTGEVKPVRQGYKDEGGKPVQGEVEFNLPYCAEHLNQSKRLRNHHNNQTNGMIIAGVIAVVLYFILFGADWIGAAKNNIEMGFRTCGMPILVFVGVAGLGVLASQAVDESRSNQPQYIDYPINSSSGGGSGLAITVSTEDTGMIGQQVRYFLNLDFKNFEAARQFKQKYPGAAILKGGELLE
jgi:hypothetical protein